MNPLPRFLGMALFVVVITLAALLSAPLWQRAAQLRGGDAAAITEPASSDASRDTARAMQATLLSQRVAFGLSLGAVVLTGALMVSFALRGRSPSHTQPPFAAAKQEFDTLARLAQSTAAQGAELTRERDVRRRAEEDAALKQELLAESLDEKIRLGRDLHDGIIQSLYALGLNLESARALLKTDAAAADKRLEEIRGSLNTAIRDVRAYIVGLAPENLRRASFSRSVGAFFEQLRAGRDAEVEINVHDEAADALTLEQNIEALQIAREAISNALRHGEARHISVRLHRGDEEVCLLVQDNGRGFDPDQGSAGHGLGNMEARAQRVGAALRLTSEPGKGTRVVATFPIHSSLSA